MASDSENQLKVINKVILTIIKGISRNIVDKIIENREFDSIYDVLSRTIRDAACDYSDYGCGGVIWGTDCNVDISDFEDLTEDVDGWHLLIVDTQTHKIYNYFDGDDTVYRVWPTTAWCY